MARTKQKAKNTAWIYKIVGNNLVYVGLSHEQYFSVRKKNHYAQFKRWKIGDKHVCGQFPDLDKILYWNMSVDSSPDLDKILYWNMSVDSSPDLDKILYSSMSVDSSLT